MNFALIKEKLTVLWSAGDFSLHQVYFLVLFFNIFIYTRPLTMLNIQAVLLLTKCCIKGTPFVRIHFLMIRGFFFYFPVELYVYMQDVYVTCYLFLLIYEQNTSFRTKYLIILHTECINCPD